MFSFNSSIIKTSLEICLVIPKERIVTLKVAELSVLGCKGLSTLVSSPTYAVLSLAPHERKKLGYGAMCSPETYL